ncbi:MAG: zincin-like metallopeptidase domain-containing protein [Gallionella sp.]|nr:zincin-like metallopeptidase domain-containing protein [Gallionella sp.]
MHKKTDKPNIYETVTAKIITSLEDGVIPWAKPWDAVKYGVFRNAVTNRPYRGLNTMLLNLTAMMQGYVDPRWLTFRNAETLGGNVKKGEKGVTVIFWKFLPKRGQVDDDGLIPEPEDDNGQERKVIPFARAYTVFNVEQCEGLDLPALEPAEAVDKETNELAEAILALPVIKYFGGRAFYSPSADVITLPPRSAFENLDLFYGTAFHEIVHHSGHPSRLNRTFGKRFGDRDYAFEELVAEIGAAFLGAHATIPFEEMRHPEYINSWLEILKGDSKAIFTAAAKAQSAADFVLDKAGVTSILDPPLSAAA